MNEETTESKDLKFIKWNLDFFHMIHDMFGVNGYNYSRNHLENNFIKPFKEGKLDPSIKKKFSYNEEDGTITVSEDFFWFFGQGCFTNGIAFGIDTAYMFDNFVAICLARDVNLIRMITETFVTVRDKHGGLAAGLLSKFVKDFGNIVAEGVKHSNKKKN